MERRVQRDWGNDTHPAMTYRPPKALRRTRALVSVLVSIVLAVGAWSLLWYGAAFWVQGNIQGWMADQDAHGGVAKSAGVVVSGYPSRIVVRLVKPHYRGVIFGESVDWRGDAVVLSARPWMPWRLRGEVLGRLEVTWGARKMKFAGQAKSVSVIFTSGREWLETLVLEVRKLHMSGSSPVVVDDLSLRGARHNQALSLTLAGHGWTLPLHGGWGLGNRIDTVDVSLRMNGALRAGKTLKTRLAHWRDAGGVIRMERVNLRAGPFALSASGSVALDKNFQPRGAFSAKMRGLFSVLEILRTRGLIQGPNAVLATMVLAAFSTRPKDGATSSISLSVSVQNRKLSLGPVFLVKIPEIDWGFAKIKIKKPQVRDYKNAPPVF